ncbi:MAG: dNTP triphosphohydrolase [Phycisphaerae bacterium]|jgi:dGTPase
MLRDLDMSRAHVDPLADTLPPLVLDRQRIVHCAAFRRLLQKTQVFVAVEADHFRTRMTHTLEVAHLARCLAVRIGLSPDLAEVVALAHDLGHPPFGHAGEAALTACLHDHGGFEHNQHTLRIVEELEHPYPDFHGLNLTRVVRICLAKHSTPHDRPGPHPLQDGTPAPPEGLIVDLADRVSYALHDLQDGLYAGVLTPTQVAQAGLWTSTDAAPPADETWPRYVRPWIDRTLARVLDDVAANDAGGAHPTVHLSPALDAWFEQLTRLLKENMYGHSRLVRADTKARRIVTAIFEAYLAEPRLLPARFHRRIGQQSPHRVITDYLAGMTDRFCLSEYARLFEAGADA